VTREISQLLQAWGNGDRSALDQLMPLVYDELRRLAASYLRRYSPQNSLQPTAVVHEAYLRLVGQGEVHFDNRVQFFGLAAQLIRAILVDHARNRQAAKRGGGQHQIELDETVAITPERTIDLIALDDALLSLAQFDSQQCRIVELRYFGGLTIEETASFLKISTATVKRDWNVARAWLHREIIGERTRES